MIEFRKTLVIYKIISYNNVKVVGSGSKWDAGSTGVLA